MNDDVAIVGAGPAGAWAALKLAEDGARVSIFDASHPREKPCGGGLTGRALTLLAGVIGKTPLQAVVVRSAQIDGEGSRGGATVPLATHGLSGRSSLVVVSRAEFDRALLATAVARGARWVRERVTDIRCTKNGATLVTARGTYTSDFVIGADGANSLVRRRLAAPFVREQLSIAAGFFAFGVRSHEIHIRTVGRPPGYLWSFPRTDHLAVGLCARADVTRTSETLRAYSHRWIHDSGVAPGATLRSYAWPIPTLRSSDFSRERPAGSRWFLIGDAAGLVDPLTREGIFYALRSSELAAEALCSRSGLASVRYHDCLREEVYPELQAAATFSSGFFDPAFANLFIEGLVTSGALRGVMVDLISGWQPYRRLRQRLISTGEVRLALRFAGLKLRRSWFGPQN